MADDNFEPMDPPAQDDFEPMNPPAQDDFEPMEPPENTWGPQQSAQLRAAFLQQMKNLPRTPQAQQALKETNDQFEEMLPPQQQTSALGAAASGALQSVVPSTGGLVAGMRAGMAAGAAATPIVGPIAGGAIGIGTGLAAGFGAGYVIDKIQNWLQQNYGPKTGILSPEYAAQAQQEHPIASDIGSLATGAVALGPGTLATKLADRVASGAIFGVVNVGQQAATKGFGNIDPTQAALATGFGAAFPTAREWTGARPSLTQEPQGKTAIPATDEGEGSGTALTEHQNATGETTGRPNVPDTAEAQAMRAAMNESHPTASPAMGTAHENAPPKTEGQTTPPINYAKGKPQQGEGVVGAKDTKIDTDPIPQDVAAAIAPEPVQTAASPVPPAVAEQPIARPASPVPVSVEQPPAAQQAIQTSHAQAPKGSEFSTINPETAPESGKPNEPIGQIMQQAMNRPIEQMEMPSIANSSKDPNGPIVIDPSVPPEFIRPLAVHETVEQYLMAQGIDYDQAHLIATQAERTTAEHMGLDWNQYSKWFAENGQRIESQKPDPASWQGMDLHEDPYAAIGHHTNKDILSDLAQAEGTPPLAQAPVPQSRPTRAQEAINTSKAQEAPQPQSLGGAATPSPLLDKIKRLWSGTAAVPRDLAEDTAQRDFSGTIYDKENSMRTNAVNERQDRLNNIMKSPEGTDEEYTQVGRAYTKKTEDQLPDNLNPHYKSTVADIAAINKKFDEIEILDPKNTVGMDERHPGFLTRWFPRRSVRDHIDRGDEDPLVRGQGIPTDPSVRGRQFQNAIELDDQGNYDEHSPVTLIKDNGDGTLTQWKGKKPSEPREYALPEELQGEEGEPQKLQIGNEFTMGDKKFLVDHADAQDIESRGLIDQATGKPIEYNKNAKTAALETLNGLTKVRDTLKLLKNIKDDPRWATMHTTDKDKAVTKWGGAYQTTHPMFDTTGKGEFERPVYYPQNVAWALNDIHSAGIHGPAALEAAANGLIKTMYVPGFPVHVLNEAVQWFINRGQRWASPAAYGNLVKTWPKAIRSVENQDAIQREIRQNGGNTQLANVLNDKMQEDIYRRSGQAMVKDDAFWGPIADKLGTKPAQLAQDTYDWSRKNMWKMNDYLYTQQYMEFKAEGMSPAEAVAKTEEYISNYRLKGTVMGNRTLARIYASPWASLFGRFHAGLFQSWADMTNGITKGDPAHRKEAIGQLMAAAVLGFVIKPYVLDPIAQTLTGNENAEFGPRGMLTIPSELMAVARGRKGIESVAPNLFTPSLPLNAGLQQLRNQNWMGKPIITRADMLNPANVARAGIQEADFLGNALVPPYSTISGAAGEKGATPFTVARKFLAGNVGIKEPSEASAAYVKNIGKYNLRQLQEHKPGLLEQGLNQITPPPKAQKAIKTSKARSQQAKEKLTAAQ